MPIILSTVQCPQLQFSPQTCITAWFGDIALNTWSPACFQWSCDLLNVFSIHSFSAKSSWAGFCWLELQSSSGGQCCLLSDKLNFFPLCYIASGISTLSWWFGSSYAWVPQLLSQPVIESGTECWKEQLQEGGQGVVTEHRSLCSRKMGKESTKMKVSLCDWKVLGSNSQFSLGSLEYNCSNIWIASCLYLWVPTTHSTCLHCNMSHAVLQLWICCLFLPLGYSQYTFLCCVPSTDC